MFTEILITIALLSTITYGIYWVLEIDKTEYFK